MLWVSASRHNKKSAADELKKSAADELKRKLESGACVSVTTCKASTMRLRLPAGCPRGEAKGQHYAKEKQTPTNGLTQQQY